MKGAPMNRLLVVLTIFLAFAFNLSVMAQDEEEGGDIAELNFFGGFAVPGGGITDFGDSLGATTGWTMGIDGGLFVTPALVVGVNFTYTQFGIDGDLTPGHHHRLFTPSVYARYYFEGESDLLPYLKAHVGVENPKFSTGFSTPQGDRFREFAYDPSLAAGLGAGLFYFTADYSGLFIETNYNVAFTEDAEHDFGDRTFIFGKNVAIFEIHAGVRILLSSGE